MRSSVLPTARTTALFAPLPPRAAAVEEAPASSRDDEDALPEALLGDVAQFSTPATAAAVALFGTSWNANDASSSPESAFGLVALGGLVAIAAALAAATEEDDGAPPGPRNERTALARRPAPAGEVHASV